MPDKKNEKKIKKDKTQALILYSGGTDSTLTAALMAQKYDRVHLLSLTRFGFFNIENTSLNVEKLRNMFGDDKFIHSIKSCEAFFKFLSYERFFTSIRKFGLFNLTTCGICKLSMHLQAIKYALDNNISVVADGANQGMDIYPAQMIGVIKMIRELYKEAGLTLENPVFELQGHDDNDFVKRLNIQVDSDEEKGETAGKKLHEMGLMPEENVKGTSLDKKMQARCFQLILFHVFARWYYLADHSMEDYTKEVNKFYKFKIDMLKPLVRELKRKGKASYLSGLCSE